MQKKIRKIIYFEQFSYMNVITIEAKWNRVDVILLLV